MKRPDRKDFGRLSALLLALVAAGCGGINANVPISPMMFLQNPPPPPAPLVQSGLELAVNSGPAAGQ